MENNAAVGVGAKAGVGAERQRTLPDPAVVAAAALKRTQANGRGGYNSPNAEAPKPAPFLYVPRTVQLHTTSLRPFAAAVPSEVYSGEKHSARELNTFSLSP